MTLAPLLNAPLAVQLHAFSAMAAFLLGAAQLAGGKGTRQHRVIGYVWVVLMAVVALSAFWIHEIRLWGPWSPIHLLSFYVLAMLPLGIAYARRHNVSGHRKTMLGMFIGALIVAGLFTFLPGRIMHQVVFGG